MYKKRIDELWKKIREYHRDNNPLVYQEMIKIPPVKDEDFKKIEELIGVALPEEFKYSYMVQNIKSDIPVFGSDFYFFSLEEIYISCKERQELCNEKFGSPYFSNKILPPNGVWDKEWVYFANIFGEEIFLIDARNVNQGQKHILQYHLGVLSLVYLSFIDMLEDTTKQLLEKGEYDEYPVDDDPTEYR